MAYDTFDTDGVATAGVTFSNGDLTAYCAADNAITNSLFAQTLEGKFSGKWYVEFTCNGVSGNVDGVGLLNSQGLAGGAFGGYIGQTTNSWGYYTNSHVANNNSTAGSVNNTTWGASAVVGMAVDLDNGLVWWTTNGTSWVGTSGTPNPATGTAGFSIGGMQSPTSYYFCRVYPAVNLSGNGAEFTLNAGASSFTYSPPSGFTGWTNTTAGTYFGTFATTGNGNYEADAPPSGNKAVSKYTAALSGTVTSVVAPFLAATTDLKAVIYDATGSGGLPGALLGVSTAFTGTGPSLGGEMTFDGFSNVTVASGTPYWIGLVSDQSGSFLECPPASGGIAYDSDTYSSPANPFGASPSTVNYRYPLIINFSTGETSTIAQTLAGVTQAGVLSVPQPTATIAQTLARVTQAGTLGLVRATLVAAIAQTLPGITQAGVLIDEASEGCCGAPGKSAAVSLQLLGKSGAFTPCFNRTMGPSPAPPPAPTPLTITGTPVTMADVDQPYAGFAVVASGGTFPYNFQVVTGTLPDGLALDPLTGAVGGTPTASGEQSGIVIRATDAAGATAYLQAFSIAVAAALEISGTPDADATVGTAYAFIPAVSGGTAPLSFALSAGTLPAGLAVDAANGIIRGTPTAVGLASGLVLTATDFFGNTGSLGPFSIDVSASAGALLSDVAYDIGALTQAGFGQVRLSSQGLNGVGALGLLEQGEVAVSWTVALSSGTAGHWAIGGTTLTGTPLDLAEGPLALTPTPTAAGEGARLDGGPYVFAITSTAQDGSTGSATLTIHAAAGAASFGDNDDLSVATALGSIAAFEAAGGTSILFSTGANKTSARNFFRFAPYPDAGIFTAPGPIIQHADPTRPGLMGEMEIGPVQNLTVLGIICQGADMNTVNPDGANFDLGSCVNLTLTNCGAIQTGPTSANANVLKVAGCTNCTFNNLTGYQVSGFITDSGGNSGLTVNGATCRYAYNNFLFLGQSDGWTLNDVTTIAPSRYPVTDGAHLDSLQIEASTSPTNMTVNRMIQIGADGGGDCHGMPFSNMAAIYEGFIDNGAGAGTPTGVAGTVLTLTSIIGDTAGIQAAVDEHGYITGPGVAAGTAPTGQIGTGSAYPQYWRVNESQVVAPTTIYTPAFKGMQMNGLIYVGDSIEGMTIASADTTGRAAFFKNFTFLLAVTGPKDGAAFLGHVDNGLGEAGNILTVETAPSEPIVYGGDPPQNLATANGLIVAGAHEIAAFGTNGTTGTGGAGTYWMPGDAQLIAPGTSLLLTPDGVFGNGPNLEILCSDQASQHVGAAGSAVIESGFMYGALDYVTAAGAEGTRPAVWDIAASAVFGDPSPYGDGSTTVDGVDAFANADPRGTLEAITTAEWAAMSDAQVVATVVSALIPKTGGPLDAGGGAAWGALTFAGLWNDGSGKTP